MIRAIGVVLSLLIFFIFSIPIFIVLEIVGHFDIKKKERASFAIVMWELRMLSRISGVKLTVEGLANVPKDTPVLYVGNHRSYFDIVTLYPLTNNTTGFVAKKEMEKLPFFHRWMKNMNCEFLDRDNLKEGLKSIQRCVATIKSGCSICIFPEGTRTPGDEMLEFKEGSFKIAEKGGCPVIPVAISNTENLFESHFPYVRPAKVVIRFGEPIYISELPREQRKRMGATVRALIADMLIENNKLLD